MKKIHWLGVIIISIHFLAVFSPGQPRLIEPEAGSYLPGEKIDPGIFVYDSDGNRVMLRDLLGGDNRAVVISLLGGAAEEPVSSTHRGNLWCEDSFDDLAVQRALMAWCRDKPVRFIAVAIPRVLAPGKDGAESIFLTSTVEDETFSAEFANFVSRTEDERIATVIPFDQVFYDPKGRLIFGGDDLGVVTEGYGEIYGWQGKFKWHLDPRTYGLPTIWILTGSGSIAVEPFWGNDYDSDPPQMNYGFAELKSAIEELLE